MSVHAGSAHAGSALEPVVNAQSLPTAGFLNEKSLVNGFRVHFSLVFLV